MIFTIKDNQNQTFQVFDKPLKVALFGFDQRIQQTLEIAFRYMGNNCATIVDTDCAQAAMFHFDNLESRVRYLEFRKQHPGFPIVAISSQDIALKDTYVLTKPLRMAKFMNIFQLIQKQLTADGRDTRSSEVHETEVHESIVPSTSDSVSAAENNVRQSAKIIQLQDQLQINNQAAESNDNPGVASTQNPADNNAAESQPDIYYVPEEYFQSALHAAYKEALEKNTVIKINLKVKDEWGSITLFPRLNKVATDLDEQQLKYVCSTPLYCFETKIIRYEKAKSKKMESSRSVDDLLVSFEAFNWEVALWTSSGRLPKGINLQTQYRLRRWPNFTRLRAIPNSFSMAALLSQNPLNINLFSKVADVSQNYIYSFFSCVYASGLLETVTGNEITGNLFLSVAQEHPRRGLFKRIVNKLKNK